MRSRLERMKAERLRRFWRWRLGWNERKKDGRQKGDCDGRELVWVCLGLACWGFWLLQTQSTGYLVLAVLSTGDWVGRGGRSRAARAAWLFVSGRVTARTLGLWGGPS